MLNDFRLTADVQKHMHVLGLTQYPFTESELKGCYRASALKHHPDLNQGVDTTKKMQEINKIYSILSALAVADSLSSDQYDDIVTLIEKPEYNRDEPFIMWEICDVCNAHGVVKHHYEGYQRECPDCVDQEARNEGFGHRDSYSYWFRSFTYGTWSIGYHRETCPDCKGAGEKLKKGALVECIRCAGKGWVKKCCTTCNGRGYLIYSKQDTMIKCDKCDGIGWTRIECWNTVIQPGAILTGRTNKQRVKGVKYDN
jgi:DnaJ-class molecular chaperone